MGARGGGMHDYREFGGMSRRKGRDEGGEGGK